MSIPTIKAQKTAADSLILPLFSDEKFNLVTTLRVVTRLNGGQQKDIAYST